MNKLQSISIHDYGYYQDIFRNNQIIVVSLDTPVWIKKCNNGDTDWVSIKSTEIPCYLEGTSEKDIAIMPISTSGSALRAYNNTSNAFYPKINQIQPRQGVKLLAFNQKDLDNAKKLLQIEYGNDTVDEAQLKETYKQVFNLSEDEINALLKEIETENAQQGQFQYQPSFIFNPGQWVNLPKGLTQEPIGIQYDAKSNGNVCKCEMIPYQGLFESYNHCKKCGKKE